MEKSFFEKTLVQNQQGFSLLEILVALTILVGAGAFVAGRMADTLEDGKVSSTKIQMNGLDARLKDFRRRCGFYPASEQGLDALMTKPTGGRECKDYPVNGFIEGDSLPQDAWNNDFVYESDGKSYNIYSYGSDGQAGGEGYDAEVYLKEKGGSKGGGGAKAGGGAAEGSGEAPAE
ncbi:MAG: type II secretion system major pseudopilin GspG [Bdellovibrionales bacterium]|nr:type II secretion system major pseudopilin GspG [Bdellovibrionales bacterium]